MLTKEQAFGMYIGRDLIANHKSTNVLGKFTEITEYERNYYATVHNKEQL